ncbi:unnamed protein product [Camellia sinensis]
MEPNSDSEHHLMIEQNTPQTMQIDPRRARFPCCIVWTPLPVISWLIPFIGHMGICREDGVILDFAGPNFVCVDNFTFGAVARYIQISKEKCCIRSHQAAYTSEDGYEQDEPARDLLTWDDATRKSTQEFQHRAYNLFTCNCHSFVANNLNRMGFQSGGWNVVNLAALIFLKGRWVSKASMIQSYLPFVIIFGLGITFGGWTFITFLAFFTFLLRRKRAKMSDAVISCHSVDAWNQHLKQANDSNKLIVVDFTASWCGPCRIMAPFFVELSKKLSTVTFLKVDVDELESVASEWDVQAMPTFMILKEGKILDKVVGAKKDELQSTIAKHVNAA